MHQLKLNLNDADSAPHREGDNPASPADEAPSSSDAPSPNPAPGEESPLAAPSALLRALAELVAREGRTRRILVARTRGEGRELLRQLALRGSSWLGFEVTTPGRLALKYAARPLALKGVRVIDSFEERALLEEAIDRTMARGGFASFRNQTERMGFRDAVRNSVVALRLAGIGSGPAERANRTEQTSNSLSRRRPSEKQRLVIHVLRAFAGLLREHNCTDTAGVLHTAIHELRRTDIGPADPEEADSSTLRRAHVQPLAMQPLPSDLPIHLIPGLGSRGLAGRFLGELQRRGARVLANDPSLGLDPPAGILQPDRNVSVHEDAPQGAAAVQGSGSLLHAVETPLPDGAARLEIDLFSAASISDELRGVLRRAIAMGARWDQVEIVAADPAAYGSALHALAEAIGVPVTFAVGLPVERTRPGRVVATWFRWVRSGFQESIIRALIESDDIRPPRPYQNEGGPWLARTLRRQRIGWGRERYRLAIDRALDALEKRSPGRFESEEKFADRRAREGKRLRALRKLLHPVIDAIPALPNPTDRTHADDSSAPRLSPSEIATAITVLLKCMRPGNETDESALRRLLHLLERIAATGTRKTDFASAAAIVESCLAIRVPTPRTEGVAPWSAVPGHLHLADLRHGGATGRPFTFLVGLDATALSGSLYEDPLLGDRERRRLAETALPLAADRAQESRFNFAQLFARLRGWVSLSYASWNPCESRTVTPAPEMLQALRLRSGNARLDFQDLKRELGDTESRLPRARGRVDLDRSDVWLRALATPEGVLLDGVDAISREFPRLAAGIAMRKALHDDIPTPATGFLGTHDPPLSYQTLIREKTLSASALESLGRCPRRFLFSRILGVFPPDDPEFDPERWLNALQRGHILHKVFEETLHKAAQQPLGPNDALAGIALDMVEHEAQKALLRIPTPSTAVQRWELDAMRDDARSFVEMIREQAPEWLHLEWKFGAEEELRIAVGQDSIAVRGAVDRVDRADGGVCVVDYKTGMDRQGGKSKIYDGGRRLQHLVYAAAVAEGLGLPVVAMEYHFPSRTGENRIRRYESEELEGGDRLIATLLEGPLQGWFPATNDPKQDCRFCDYTELCGVKVGRWNQVEGGPFSEWTARNCNDHAELEPLVRVRTWESDSQE